MNILIDIIDKKANISPIKLIVPGKLLLDSIKNNKINRFILDKKKSTSNNLLLTLLINKPINKESAIDDKLCDKLIIIPVNIPLLFKDKIELNVKFKCNIEENAITFFKS